MMAAGQAALSGAEVILLEKMKRPGRKLGITGKGRCNLTNIAEIAEFISHFGKNGTFLRQAFSQFFSSDLMEFIEYHGVALNIERGGRVFPKSGKAPEVVAALEKWLHKCRVNIQTNTTVNQLIIENNKVTGVTSNGKEISADAVILATGGASYPRTGSTGDGYKFARIAGHTIVPVRPALVPLEAIEDTSGLNGLNLRNIRAKCFIDGKKFRKEFGELTFIDGTVSGPVVLKMSGDIVDALREKKKVEISIDMKPALDEQKLDNRLIRDFEKRGQEPLKSVLRGLMAKEMVPVCLSNIDISENRMVSEISLKERHRLKSWLKDFRLEIKGHRPFSEAIITAGGVNTDEIDPKTMESKKVKGLYIVGELLDINGDTGGYNLQAAFSTGYVAGISVNQSESSIPSTESPILRHPAIAECGGQVDEAKSKLGEPKRDIKLPIDLHKFIPTTKEEMKSRGWDKLDIILITGDSYIDSAFCGVTVIGKVLLNAGYKVGIIAQPASDSGDIQRLGEPTLFWGVTGGCIDSMVANYTATKKRRQSDDYTPGGVNDRRPDRAVISYSNLIRRNFKGTVPIVLGGLEASLRRVAHYDFWSNKIRRSILFDAKADYLLYGMADKSVANFANSLKKGRELGSIRGLCYISKEIPENAISLPSFEEVSEDKQAFTEMFHTFYKNNDPIIGETLCQQYDNRYLVQNPPEFYMTTKELDDLYALGFENEQHPYYEKQGKVRALDTIRFSIATHRGCYGECNFCSIAVHQGQTVRWRSKDSIISEAKKMTQHPKFKGIISDVGGPTANMYGYECIKKPRKGPCTHRCCVYPRLCKMMKPDHGTQTEILCELRKISGIKKVFVGSGIRYDLIEADEKHGDKYFKEIVNHHVSGQLKVAPEHSEKA